MTPSFPTRRSSDLLQPSPPSCVVAAMGSEVAPIVVEGRNCWRIERADKARMIVDAADYYALLERLMADAKERILLIGWDFDPRIALKPDKDGKGEPLGEYMLRLDRKSTRLNSSH